LPKEGFKISGLNSLLLQVKCAVDTSQKLQSGLKSKQPERKGQTPLDPRIFRENIALSFMTAVRLRDRWGSAFLHCERSIREKAFLP